MVPGPRTRASKAPNVLELMSDCALLCIVRTDKNKTNAAVIFLRATQFY
jgi:hypothetical protein